MVIFLQRAADSRRVYAHVTHARANTDGHKGEGVTFPSGAVQKNLLQEVYSLAGVSPSDVSYVEAHGTGTKVGLPLVLGALWSVVGGVFGTHVQRNYVYLNKTHLLLPVYHEVPSKSVYMCVFSFFFAFFFHKCFISIQAGDPQEVNALSDVFCNGRSSPLLMGSVKSNMGHAEPASGLCSIVKVKVTIAFRLYMLMTFFLAFCVLISLPNFFIQM